MSTNSLILSLNALCNITTTTTNPYAGGILNGAKAVIEGVIISKDNDDTCRSLGKRVLEISASCISSLPKEGAPRDLQVACYIGQFIHVLDRIAKRLVVHNQRGRMSRLMLRSHDVATLKELGEQLEQCASMLSFHLQMDNLRLSTKLNDKDQFLQSEVEQAVAKAQKEELESIKSHFMIRSNQTFSQSHLPPPPHIFHGRSDEIRRIVQVLLRDEASYVCILGTGGIGKTSFGLAALHHPEVMKCYHHYRYFVPCDALTDAAGLLRTLASMFRVAEKEFWIQFPGLCRQLKRKILLLMDNFETPWESAASRKEVETFLSKLADVPNLSIALTLRGAERPYGIPWSRPFINPLPTLDMASAKRAFVEISDTSEDAEGLEKLLQAVDMLPLAVTLLANQAQLRSCSELLDLWNAQRTSMVTRGIQDRISSLDVSIQISLSSPRLIHCPDAIKLLQILSILPDGTDDQALKQIVPQSFDFTSVTVVLRVGLAYRNEVGRFRSLSPVREHLQIFQPMEPDMFRSIAVLHNNLARYAEENFSEADLESRPLMMETIGSQIGNLHVVLALSLHKTALQKDAAAAIAKIHYFHRLANSGPNRILLDAALVTACSLADPGLEAECLLILHCFEPRDLARIYLDDALAIYRTLEDPRGLSRCLAAISRLNIRHNPAKVLAAATEVIEMLQDVTPKFDLADSYEVMVHQHVLDGNMQMGWSFARRGLGVFHSNWHAKAKLLYCIANIHGFCGQLSAALNCLNQSAEIMERFGLVRSYLPHECIGQIYFMQSRFALAATALNHAASIVESTPLSHRTACGPYQAAIVAIRTGDIPLAISKCQLLHSMYLKGESKDFEGQRPMVQRFLSCALAEVEMFARNWGAAFIHLQSAQACEKKIGWTSKYPEVESLLRYSDLLTATEATFQSLHPAIVAAILCCRRQGDPFGLSMALQRIGDVFYTAEDNSHGAKACYEAELNIIEDPVLNMGANRHAGDCLLRLGMVALKSRNMDEARTKFKRAGEFYITAEDKDGVTFCESRLVDLVDLESATNMVLPPLPLGNRLIATY